MSTSETLKTANHEERIESLDRRANDYRRAYGGTAPHSMYKPGSPVYEDPAREETGDSWSFLYRNFAALWFDGFPLGNGDLGALMLPDHKQLTFKLGKSNVWNEECDNGDGEHKSFQAFANFAELRDLIAAEKWDEIDERTAQAEARWRGKFGMIPAGSLVLNTVRFEKEIEVFDFERALDMSCGIARNDYSTRVRNQQVEALVSVAHDVLAVRVRCTLDAGQGEPYRAMRLGFDASLQITPSDPNAEVEAGSDGDAMWRRLNGYHEVEYCLAAQAVGDNIRVEPGPGGGSSLTVLASEQDGDTAEVDFTIYLALVSRQDVSGSDDVQAEALRRVRAAAAVGYEDIRAEHEAWWRNFWSASRISIPETTLLRQYHFGLYLLGSSSRRGYQMPGLQGLWPYSVPIGVGWNEYTVDLNIEMNYWPVYTSNHLELAAPYYDTVRGWLPETRRFTREYYGCDGVQFSCCASPTGIMPTCYLPTAHWFGHAAFVAQNFWTHYLYSRDETFLREVAYPFLKECASFYCDFLQKDERGFYEFWPSSNPEASEGSYEAWGKNPATDIAYVRMLMEAVIASTQILGTDIDFREACREILDNLPPYPTRDGALIEMESKEFFYSQRHTGGLAPIYPCSDWATEEHRENAEKSLDLYLAKGYELTGCHTAAWVGCVAARLGRGQQARDALHEFVTSYTLPQGGFNLNYDYHRTGRMCGTPVFCNESNSGYSANLLEMLLQSHGGTLRIFPAVPDDWQDASFENLRAEGAFLVSAQRSGGIVESIEIFSECGGEVRLENPWSGGVQVVCDSQPVETWQDGSRVSWESRPGCVYQIKLS